jgi:guanine nucleotide-binding protein G(I)/G(S)/G(T) subunit beta-1
MDLSIPSNENYFVSGSCDNACCLFDIRSGICERKFIGHLTEVNTVKFFPNGYSFASGSEDTTIRLFDLRANKELMIYKDKNLNDGVKSISFSKSGRYLFSAYNDKNIVMFDVVYGKIVQNFNNKNEVSYVTVSPFGNVIASCGSYLSLWA